MRTLTLAFLLVGCRGAATKPVVHVTAQAPVDARSAGISDPRLAALLHEHWDGLMRHNPTWATMLGDHRFDGDAPDSTRAAEEAWTVQMQSWVDRLRALDALSPTDALTRDLLVTELEGELGQAICHYGDWSFSPRSNPMLEANDQGERFELAGPETGRLLVRRIQGMTRDLDVQVGRLREGLQEGRVANRPSTERVIEQTRGQLALPVAQWPLLKPLGRMPDSWSDDDRSTFRTQLTSAAEGYAAALERWVALLETEILPAARTEGEGLVGVPDGLACYDAMILHHTTLPLPADTIHQTGLDEIARLHREVAALGATEMGTEDIGTIFERLRTDPALYFTTEEEVEAKAKEALARAKAAIPAWFGRLPEAECTVERVPPYEAPYTTIAYYRPVVPGERPGTYVVNTYEPSTRPRHEAEVLAFHESIPGHHLQIALAQETGELPLFRRHLGATAFVEGWALYTEQLAEEMGLYSGPTDRFGMYSFELWRAARLVVDTGIHAKGWTREQAIEFMVDNTPLARNNIENEVDRYITTPGQALAYKTGQLEIWKLRREAEAALGDRFDIKGFHDVVLGAGAVSLPVLRSRVEAWVTEQG